MFSPNINIHAIISHARDNITKHAQSLTDYLSQCHTGSITLLLLFLLLLLIHYISITGWNSLVQKTEHIYKNISTLDYMCIFVCIEEWPNFSISHFNPIQNSIFKHSRVPFKNCFKCENSLKLEFYPLHTINAFISSALFFPYVIVEIILSDRLLESNAALKIQLFEYSSSSSMYMYVCICIRFECTIDCLLYVYNT